MGPVSEDVDPTARIRPIHVVATDSQGTEYHLTMRSDVWVGDIRTHAEYLVRHALRGIRVRIVKVEVAA